MKRFLKRFAFFFVPILAWFVLEAFLPVTTFTHRTFEAVEFKTEWLASTPTYPSVNNTTMAQGDMCHHTPHAVLKKETWITDKYGLRNEEFVEQPDVLFVGDSFFYGSTLSQDELISNRVKAEFDNKISTYNLSPTGMSDFDRYLSLGLIKKPKLLIYSIVERNVPHPLYRYTPPDNVPVSEKIAKALSFGNMNVYLDKAIRHYSLEWIRARLHQTKGYGTPGIPGSGMYYFQGASHPYKYEDLEPTVGWVTQYKNYCESLGIKFLFVPMANKETVYYDQVPFEKQPDYLFKLDTLLRQAGIHTVNTVQAYNEFRKSNKELLYHTDDTHWNGNATKLIGKEIAREIREKKLLH